jgi:DNA-binding transcriptional MerR regulator
MSERLWFKIGQAAEHIGVTPKELRYWERLIPEIKPRRSRGNLRYYHLDELPRLQRIKEWLAEGLTVADCKALLQTGHLARALDMDLESDAPSAPQPHITRRKTTAPASSNPLPPDRLHAIHDALKTLHARLTKAPKPNPSENTSLT